ncbi:GrpB family protein [Coraliomargarita sp. W4R53]
MGTSSVAPYSNEWPIRFLEKKERIRSAFSHLSCGIYHAGSSSITNLPAKPVIDIALALESNFSMSDVLLSLSRDRQIGFCRLS